MCVRALQPTGSCWWLIGLFHHHKHEFLIFSCYRIKNTSSNHSCIHCPTDSTHVHNLKYLCKLIFLRNLHSHTCKQATQSHTITSKHTHCCDSYDLWALGVLRVNKLTAVRMHRRSKVTSHGQWQYRYDHVCQGHDPNMLDQLLRSITPFPDHKLERGLVSALYQSHISNHIYTKVFHVIKLPPQIQRR